MELKKMYNNLDKILNGQDKEPMLTIEKIKKEIESEILSDGKINVNMNQAFKRLLNDNKIRPAFQSVLNNDNKYFTITNGCYLVTYTSEQLPEQLKAYKSKEVNKYNINFEQCRNTNELVNLALNFEALKKIHKYNKLHKNTDLFLTDDGFAFNIQYFLDILALLNYKNISSDIILEYYPKNRYTPMNIKSKNGNAILLPVRLDNAEKIQELLEIQNDVINNGGAADEQ